ncbi:MAG: ribosome assembly cofactor RimP [Bacteroidales bacterium]|nr:ribosome assembly cofactor RimP [Bacteroides sp.]MCM1198239.1 ribosome assembly cofactor RimP [Clostridium sp.]MCM1501365.1 ribosome assembly cofactor RimP [Bacteroidales bacterium]
MVISEIRDAMEDAIVARNCFIVEIKISKDNEIGLTVESVDGQVDLDDCVALSRIFEEKFDREKEDYELTVSSAGLDQPFKVSRQYTKAIGTMVEVMLKGGKRLIAELTGADEDGIQLKYTSLEAAQGKKKKEKVEHNDRFSFDQVNSVRPHIVF